MTFGPATGLAIAAALIATLFWWLILKPRPGAEIIAMLLYAFALAIVVLAGPLIKLP